MKKIILVACMISGALFSGAQTIPNPSFEDWANYSLGERPVFWNTSDSLTVAVGAGHSAVKEATYKCDQSYAAKMTSIGITFPVAATGPGVITNGVITVNGLNYAASGGTPDTARSRFLSGCLKYIPAAPGTDKGVISAFLFRWNGTARDTVAYTVDTIETTLVMTNFNYGFNYIDFDNQPDTILIILQSSKGISNATAGSELTVDNLALSGWVGIDESASPVSSMKLFPMPANQEITVVTQLSRSVSVSYDILNVTGQVVATNRMGGETEKIDVSVLPVGIYFFVLRDDAGKKLISDKFTIVR